MKIYKYSEQELTYVPHTLKFRLKQIATVFLISLPLSIFFCYCINSYYHDSKKIKRDEELKVIILKEQNKFDNLSLIRYLKELNIKFPHIVYAQAMLESTNFHSKIFKENNNMFGMKVATLRQSTNIGEQYNHAAYDTWKDCVVDYALYQARYLSQIKTEEQYFEYLSQSYAEDTGYIQKVRTIINKNKLTELFK